MPTENASMYITWHIVDTLAEYLAATPNENDLYFIADTKQIYRGSNLFDQAYELYEDGVEPDVKAQGRIYFNSTTLEGKVWNGTAFNTIIRPVVTEVSPDGLNPVTGSAVANYIAAKGVTKVYWDDATGNLTICDSEDNVIDTAVIDGLAHSLGYDSTSGELYMNDATNTKIGTGIFLDLERFVTSAEYDAVNKRIILYFDKETTKPLEERDHIIIPVRDLVDVYTVSSTNSLTLEMDNLNNITGAVKLSAAENNAIIINNDGLFVESKEIDVGSKADKVMAAIEGNLAGLNAEGNLTDSGVKAGGATFAETPDDMTLATEAAVQAIIDALTFKLDPTNADEVVIVGADGSISASGVKVGGATLSEVPDDKTLATEAAVASYFDGNLVSSAEMAASVEDASDTMAISEKAVAERLTWKQGM